MSPRIRTAGWPGPVALAAVVLVVAPALIASPRGHRASAGSDGSGGRAVAHHPGRAVVSSRAAASRSPDARLHRIRVKGEQLDAAEPTLGLTRKGDLYYTAFQSNIRIEVVKSRDEGRSWRIVSPNLGSRNAHLVSFDPYLYVDKDTSRVFNIDLTVACSYLSFTDGKGWTTNPLACGRPVNDHQTLFSGPPATSTTIGYPNVVYYCWNDVGSSSCSKSLDGGITFIPTGTPAYPGVDPTNDDPGFEGVPGFCGGLHGHGFVAHDGTVLLPKGHCGQPWLAISKDEGRTWTRVQVAKNGTAEHEADAVMDRKGNVYYLWIARNRLPYLAVSRNKGKTWSKPMMIAPPKVTETNLPAMDIGGTGKIAIVYMGTENARGPIKKRRYANVTWNGYMTMTANALSRRPTFYTSTVNDKSDPLIRRDCGPGRCHAVFDFIDVVVARDGTPWGAFVDGCIGVCGTRAGVSNIGSDAIVGRLVGGPSLR
jgi:hypothetical protein